MTLGSLRKNKSTLARIPDLQKMPTYEAVHSPLPAIFHWLRKTTGVLKKISCCS